MHERVLQMLLPVRLGGVFGVDAAVEGAALDAVVSRTADLLHEIFPDTSSEHLNCWERVVGVVPGSEDSLALRRDRVITRLRASGALSVAYFIALGTSMGYTIAIDENVGGNPFLWRVTFLDLPTYEFRAGESAAGDRLLWWDEETAIEGLFTELKPAHTRVIFAYA